MSNETIRTLDDVCAVIGKRLVKKLSTVMHKDYIPTWFRFNQSNPRFDNKSPYDLYASEHKKEPRKKVNEIIYYLSSCEPF